MCTRNWSNLWLGCSACCGCTAWSYNGKICCNCCMGKSNLVFWMLVLPSIICTISSLHTSPLISSPSSECQLWQQVSSCCNLLNRLPKPNTNLKIRVMFWNMHDIQLIQKWLNTHLYTTVVPDQWLKLLLTNKLFKS